MADYDFSVSEFTELAERVDALSSELSSEERSILFAVFRMAGDYIHERSAAGAERLPSPAPAQPGAAGGMQGRLDALEARVRQLEARLGPLGGGAKLERLGGPLIVEPSVQLQTKGGGLPKLSDGFIGSFRGGGPARVMTDDDIGVGVNVGIMF